MRLIDADALIKNLSYLYTKNHIPVDMRAKEILTTIMEQSTAYDVDKVVKELNELDVKAIKRYKGGTFGDYEGTDYYIKKSDAIEIVKQGSVSDDTDNMCEWKYTKEIMDNAEFKVGCNTDALKRGVVPNNFSYHDFKYCPYCGKKIKVVE